MILLKKLIFAPIFLIVFAILLYQINPLLGSYDFIFSFSFDTMIRLAVIVILISLSSFLFVLFASIALDWKVFLPIAAVACILPILFLDRSVFPVFAVAILVSLWLIYLSLDSTLHSYLTFQPSSLLGPSIRNLCGLLILSFSIIYFFQVSRIIAKEGFQVPDSLIDTALKMTPVNQEQSSTAQELPAINPTKTQDLTNDLIKQTVKDQIQNFIKPYLNFIPAILTLLLFLILQSSTALINILIYPLLWITFTILENTGFIKFETEQRPVKKMVV